MFSSSSSLSISDLTTAIQETENRKQDCRRRPKRSLLNNNSTSDTGSSPLPTAKTPNRDSLHSFLDHNNNDNEPAAIDGSESVAGKSVVSTRRIQQRRMEQRNKIQRRSTASRVASERTISSTGYMASPKSTQVEGPLYQSLPVLPFHPTTELDLVASTNDAATKSDNDLLNNAATHRRRAPRSRRYQSDSQESDSEEARQRQIRRQRRAERRRRRQAYQWAQENREALLDHATASSETNNNDGNNNSTSSTFSMFWNKNRPNKWIGNISRKIQSSWRRVGGRDYSFSSIPTSERATLLTNSTISRK